jgi:predicted ester cyclase
MPWWARSPTGRSARSADLRRSGLTRTIPPVTPKRLELIRTYWEASERGDWQTAGGCIGPGYRWIDHATGVDARSAEELQQALADASCWSNGRIEVEEAFDTRDGAIIVRAVHSGNVTGSWRSMEATGQHITYQACTIFKFNEDDQIVHEEAYYDMATVVRQLGYDMSASPNTTGRP